MKTLQSVEEPIINSIAPTIYIDSIDFYTQNATAGGSVNKYKINFSLNDPERLWINNEEVYNSLNVSVSYYNTAISQSIVLFEDTLSNLKNRGVRTETELYISAEITEPFPTPNNFFISASCGNALLSGDVVVEPLKIDGIFPESVIYFADGKQQNFEYIKKIRDLNILKLPDIQFSASVSPSRNVLGDLNVSYTINKEALLGVSVDLEKALEQSSRPYNYFKNYPFFKEQILNNSKILVDKTYFSKSNKTQNSKNYNKINSAIKSLKIDDNKNIYYLTTIDDTKNFSDFSEYSAKINLAIQDYSYTFYQTIKNSIQETKGTLTKLKLLFIDNLSNKNLVNINEYIYKNFYTDNLIVEIEKSINNLLQIIRFFNANSTNDEVLSLLISFMHPLLTSVSSINLLEDYLIKIESIFTKFFKDSGVFASGGGQEKLSSVEIEKFFYKTTIDGFRDDTAINYNFEKGYGFEVFSSDNNTIRKNETPTGIKEYETFYKTTRILLEINKYFSRYATTLENTLRFFSISTLDLGQSNYNFIIDQSVLNNTTFNEAFFKLSQYTNQNFTYNIYESSFFQLANKNFLIKNISNKNNISTNDLVKTTIFDPNLDSKQQSLEFIVSTGIYDLVKALEPTKIKETDLIKKFDQLTSSIDVPQAFARKDSISVYGTSRFNVTDDILKNYDNKGQIIFRYNSLYYDNQLLSGSNYSLYELQELNVSDLFTETQIQTASSNINKKLRHLNKYYIIKNKDPLQYSPPALFELKELLNFNYSPKYINRKTIRSKYNFSIDII